MQLLSTYKADSKTVLGMEQAGAIPIQPLSQLYPT